MRALDAELVALRVGHGDPPGSLAVPVVLHDPGAQRHRLGHRLVARHVDGLDVEVDPVLGDLALGDRDEQQAGAVEGERRRHHDFGVVVVVDVPSGQLRPEPRQRARVVAVEGDVVKVDAHPHMVPGLAAQGNQRRSVTRVGLRISPPD